MTTKEVFNNRLNLKAECINILNGNIKGILSETVKANSSRQVWLTLYQPMIKKEAKSKMFY